MKNVRLLLLAAAAAAAGGCGLSPFILPETDPAMHRLELPPPAPQAGSTQPPGPRQEAVELLATARDFDEPYEDYSSRFEASMSEISRTGVVSGDLPPEGLLYYFDRRVLAEGRAYEELARAAAARKDWGRAERYAMDAAALCDQRAYSDYARATGAREAWALLEKLETDRKASGPALVAQMNRKLAEDFLASADGKAAERAYYEQEFADKTRAASLNRVIADQNLRTVNQQLGAVAGGLAAAQSGLASMQQTQIQNQVRSQGYMTKSQASQLQSAQMSQLQAQIVMKMTAGRGGEWEQRLNGITGLLSPTSFRQFLLPTAGVNPTGIVQQFGELAKSLSPDPELTQRADDVIRAAQKLGAARKSGPASAQDAFSQMMPQLQQLISDVRRTP